MGDAMMEEAPAMADYNDESAPAMMEGEMMMEEEMMGKEEEEYVRGRYDDVSFVWPIGICWMIVFGSIGIATSMTLKQARLDGADKCGIPVVWWDEVFLSVMSCMSIVGILAITVALITAKSTPTGVTLGVGAALIWLFLVSWTIYGYTIIGSEENDCGMNPDTSGYQTLMIVLICFGSIPLVYLGCAICVGIGVGIYQMVKPAPSFNDFKIPEVPE